MIRLSLSAALLATAVPAAAQQVPAPVATVPADRGVAIRADGLVATWYPPAAGKRGPAIIVLGGSEGGQAGARRIGQAVAAQGYGVLALAWFGAEGLPPHLQDVPLEYFGKAIGWLQAQPLVDRKRVGLYGISKGGEAALLIAARQPEIAAVVAAMPSSVVWQGLNQTDYTSVRSSFSVGGKPVAYVPYDMSAPFTSIHDLYQRSLATPAAQGEAVIPVERINGPVLLLSGRNDVLWPSSAMADQVIARLTARRFRHPHRHIAYPDAGHGATVPAPAGGAAANSAARNLGGTEPGNAFARRDSWEQTVAFFARALGGPAR